MHDGTNTNSPIEPQKEITSNRRLRSLWDKKPLHGYLHIHMYQSISKPKM